LQRAAQLAHITICPQTRRQISAICSEQIAQAPSPFRSTPHLKHEERDPQLMVLQLHNQSPGFAGNDISGLFFPHLRQELREAKFRSLQPGQFQSPFLGFPLLQLPHSLLEPNTLKPQSGQFQSGFLFIILWNR
jgi:hypothetical protein